MLNESKYCRRVIEKEFNKPLVMTKQKIAKRILKNLLNVRLVKTV